MKKNGVSRRNFLSKAAKAGALSLAVPSFIRAGANDAIGVAFIGVGARGTQLLSETLKLAESGEKVKPVAVCDVYDVRLQKAAKAAKLPPKAAFRDFREVLKLSSVDAVVIATPDHWHADMTLEALKAGKDVYCESPFTQSYEQARQISEEAEKLKKVVQVGVTECSDSRCQDAFDLIDGGKIGKVLLTTASRCLNSREGAWNTPIDKEADPKKNLDFNAFLGPARKTSWDPERFFRWRKFWDYSGGPISTLLYNPLTYLLLAIDGPDPEFPRRATSFGGIYQYYDREVPDTLVTTVDYPSNHTFVLVSCLANDVGIPEIIRGHEGSLLLEGNDLVLRMQETITGKKGEVRIACKRPGTAAEHLKNFFQCIRSRKEPACPPYLAYRAQVAIHMAVVSYREGNSTYWHRRKEQIYLCGEALKKS